MSIHSTCRWLIAPDRSHVTIFHIIVFFFKKVFFNAYKGKLNRNYKASFKFILKSKKLNNINKAIFIIKFFIKTIRKVKGTFIINNLKIIYYKVYYLVYLIAF
jgi:hypothetical protein